MEQETSKQSAELAAITSAVDFRSLDDIMAFGDKIAKSQICPLKNAKDVVAAVLFGRELGMPPMVSINNIYPINGRGTLSVHLMNALLQKNGIVVKVVRDFEPVVAFAQKEEGTNLAAFFDANGKQVKRNDAGETPQGAKPFILREGFADEEPKPYEAKGTKIIGYRTVIRFTRLLKQPDGTFRETQVESSYSTMEAYGAQLMGNPKKENWVKYPKPMVQHRAFAFGARFIAGDLLLGMHETSEMADQNNLPYRVIDVDHVEIISKRSEEQSKTEEDTGNQSEPSDAGASSETVEEGAVSQG